MPGSAGNWDLGAIARWKIEQESAKSVEVERTDPNEKPKSKRERDKDREQAAKAELLEIKARKELGELVELQEIQGFISLTAGRLRDALDRLQRDCGERAFTIMSEVLDEIERDVREGLLEQSTDAD